MCPTIISQGTYNSRVRNDNIYGGSTDQSWILQWKIGYFVAASARLRGPLRERWTVSEDEPHSSPQCDLQGGAEPHTHTHTRAHTRLGRPRGCQPLLQPLLSPFDVVSNRWFHPLLRLLLVSHMVSGECSESLWWLNGTMCSGNMKRFDTPKASSPKHTKEYM